MWVWKRLLWCNQSLVSYYDGTQVILVTITVIMRFQIERILYWTMDPRFMMNFLLMHLGDFLDYVNWCGKTHLNYKQDLGCTYGKSEHSLCSWLCEQYDQMLQAPDFLTTSSWLPSRTLNENKRSIPSIAFVRVFNCIKGKRSWYKAICVICCQTKQK